MKVCKSVVATHFMISRSLFPRQKNKKSHFRRNIGTHLSSYTVL